MIELHQQFLRIHHRDSILVRATRNRYIAVIVSGDLVVLAVTVLVGTSHTTPVTNVHFFGAVTPACHQAHNRNGEDQGKYLLLASTPFFDVIQ